MFYNLKIENDYCFLDTDDESLRTKLWQALRIRAKNYFHSAAYKRKVWDGYIDFFKLNTGRFLTGLLPEVKTYLNAMKIPCKISDMRQAPIWMQSSIDKYFLDPTKKIELHDYQVDSVNQLIKYGRGIVQLPTACHALGQKILMWDGTLKNVEAKGKCTKFVHLKENHS